MTEAERTPGPSIVAITCWLDLCGYGSQMNTAEFDPDDPRARVPIRRLRTFHGIVAKHSSVAFQTLAMNDGAAAYRNIPPVKPNIAWRFVERCWSLYCEASKADQSFCDYGLRGVISVGLRREGSARGIRAQEDQLFSIIDDLADGKIGRDMAKQRAKAVRRVFDIVPQLQANFAFALAYEAERAGTKSGFVSSKLYLDTRVFRDGTPSWFCVGNEVKWEHPKLPFLSGDFVPINDIQPVSPDTAGGMFRTGAELMPLLRRAGGHYGVER